MLSARQVAPCFAVIAAALLPGTVARAEEEESAVTARLEWERARHAENCIDGDSLEGAVNRRWGRQIFVDAPRADIVVHGRIGRGKRGGFAAVIELRRESGASLGTREIRTAAPDCSSLDDSVALAVGLMLDVSRRQLVEERAAAVPEARDGTVDEAAGRRDTTAAEEPTITVPKETLAPRASWRVSPWASVETSEGLLPSLGLAANVGLGLAPPRFFKIEASAQIWQHQEHLDAQGRGADWALWTAELDVCPLVHETTELGAQACVAQRFGEIRSTGHGFDQTETASEPLWTVGLRAAAAQALVGPLAIRVGAGAEVPILRYRFVYTDSGGGVRVVSRMTPVAGSVELGLALRW